MPFAESLTSVPVTPFGSPLNSEKIASGNVGIRIDFDYRLEAAFRLMCVCLSLDLLPVAWEWTYSMSEVCVLSK